MQAPRPPPRPRRFMLHGRQHLDPYAWMRRLRSPEVQALMDAENAHTRAWFAPLEPLEAQLRQEIRARVTPQDRSVPWRWADFEVWHEVEAGEQHGRWMRRNVAANGPAEAVLDLEPWARRFPGLDLGDFELSPDGRLLAYTLDKKGTLNHELRIRRLDRHGRPHLPWRVRACSAFAWSACGRYLFFVTQDAAHRAYRLWRHALDDAQADVLLLEERDERFSLDIGPTRDRLWLVVTASSMDSSEVRVIPAASPLARPRRLIRRQRGREVGLDHRCGQFLLLVNDQGPNFRLCAVNSQGPLNEIRLDQATPLSPHREEALLEDIDTFDGFVVLTWRQHAQLSLEVVACTPGAPLKPEHFLQAKALPHASPLGNAWVSDNPQFDTPVLRYARMSMTQAAQEMALDVGRWRTRVLKTEVIPGYEPQHYDSRRITVPSTDGVLVPITLVWRKGHPSDWRLPRRRPVLLEGYGAYGLALDAGFSRSRLSLLDRGVVVAMAHVRGGSDCGRRWYEQGKLAHKHHSFEDMVACAQGLVALGWTRKGQIVLEGGSAGGLLVVGAAQRAPEWLAGVVAEVPFLDVLNTMLDPTLPLTVGEYLEWGNPQQRQAYRWIASYAPYENIRQGPFPPLWMRTSEEDAQVPAWEALKFAARLRDHQTAPSPVLVHVDRGVGHAGSTGRFDALDERARTMAFMLWCWGLTANVNAPTG